METMKLFPIALLFLAAFSSGSALASHAPTKKERAFHVTWKLTGDGNVPAGGAEVKVIGPIGQPFSVRSFTTSSQGVANLQVDQPGRYYAMASSSNMGFAFTELNINRDAEMSSNLQRPHSSVATIHFFDQQTSQLVTNVKATTPSVRGVRLSQDRDEVLVSFAADGSTQATELTFSHPQYEIRKYTVSVPTLRYESYRGYAITLNRVSGSNPPATIPTVPPGSTVKIPVITQNRMKLKLDGMIRMTNRDKIVVGKVCTVSANLVYSGGVNSTSIGSMSIVIKDPNGRVILNRSTSLTLPLNAYAEKKFDITPDLAGKYTVTVDGTGEAGTKWTGTFHFTASAK